MKKLTTSVLLSFWCVLALWAQAVDRNKLLAAGEIILDRGLTQGAGQWFTRDCSGTINAIFAEAGYPLAKRLNKAYKSGMSGTATLHAISEEVVSSDLQPGDLIFFDNTYDRNNNGVSDDLFTHVAMVTRYDASQQVVHFIHYNTWMDKIIEQQLSLREPTNKDLNIILRWPSKNDPQAKRYAGELINSFGRITTYE